MSEVVHYGRNIKPEEMRDMIGLKPFIIEIGCNDGEDTKRFLEAMPGAQVVCFEPDPRALARFDLRDDPRVTLKECGVTHRIGESPFWQSTGVIPGSTAPCKADWDYSGGFSPATGHLERDHVVRFKDEPIYVPTVTLDYYYDEYQHPVDWIWADTQGSEAKVILGGQKTLMNTRYVYIEWYPTPQYEKEPNLEAICCFMPDFELVATYSENALFKNTRI